MHLHGPVFSAYLEALLKVFPKAPRARGASSRVPWARPAWVRESDQPCPPSPYWQPGRRPPDEVDIDARVRELISDRDAQSLIRLRPQDELEQRGVIDPYLVAREFAALAHVFGWEADRRQKSTPRRSAYTKQIKDDQDAIELLRKPLAVSDLLLGADLQFPTRRPDYTSSIDHDGAQSSAEPNRGIKHLHQEIRKSRAELAKLLELRVAENISRSASAPVRARGVYLSAFVEVMGHAWHLLTGREPGHQPIALLISLELH